MATYSVGVEFSGPLFDGEAQRAADDFARAALDEVAHQGFANVRTNEERSFKHPTPYYETQTRLHASQPGEREITDAGIIYGHWLEGDGSMNFPRTRFRGYASYRRAAQQLEPKVVELAEHVLPPHLARMN